MNVVKLIDLKINANLDRVDNSRLAQVKNALAVLKEVTETNVFKIHLITQLANSNHFEGELSEFKDYTPEMIYAHLFSLYEGKGALGFSLSTYYNFWTSAVAETNGMTISLNTKFLDSMDEMDLASCILHECGHVGGFEHDFKNTTRRKNSISYILNRAFEGAYRQLRGLPQVVEAPIKIPWYKKIFRSIFG